MARSRKKSSARATSSAKAASTDPKDVTPEPEELTAEAEDTTTDAEDATAEAEDSKPAKGSAKDPLRRRGAAGKDPVGRGARRGTSGKKKGESETGRPDGGEVPEKAKDSTRATSVRRAAAAETSRTTGRRVAAAGQNPRWLAPAAVVFLILGLAYLVTYYITAGQLPLPIGDWNLAVGFGVLMVGGGMLMFWK
ncbi:cell division protein CrgA [Brachybacterium paraconglomeratum]